MNGTDSVYFLSLYRLLWSTILNGEYCVSDCEAILETNLKILFVGHHPQKKSIASFISIIQRQINWSSAAMLRIRFQIKSSTSACWYGDSSRPSCFRRANRRSPRENGTAGDRIISRCDDEPIGRYSEASHHHGRRESSHISRHASYYSYRSSGSWRHASLLHRNVWKSSLKDTCIWLGGREGDRSSPRTCGKSDRRRSERDHFHEWRNGEQQHEHQGGREIFRTVRKEETHHHHSNRAQVRPGQLPAFTGWRVRSDVSASSEKWPDRSQGSGGCHASRNRIGQHHDSQQRDWSDSANGRYRQALQVKEGVFPHRCGSSRWEVASRCQQVERGLDVNIGAQNLRSKRYRRLLRSKKAEGAARPVDQRRWPRTGIAQWHSGASVGSGLRRGLPDS